MFVFIKGNVAKDAIEETGRVYFAAPRFNWNSANSYDEYYLAHEKEKVLRTFEDDRDKLIPFCQGVCLDSFRHEDKVVYPGTVVNLSSDDWDERLYVNELGGRFDRRGFVLCDIAILRSGRQVGVFQCESIVWQDINSVNWKLTDSGVEFHIGVGEESELPLEDVLFPVGKEKKILPRAMVRCVLSGGGSEKGKCYPLISGMPGERVLVIDAGGENIEVAGLRFEWK